MPGLINKTDGRNHTYMANDWQEQPLQDYMATAFDKPVFIINDVKSAAIAELKFGLAKGRNDVLVILMDRSEEHTSELQSLMRISYAVFCLKKKNTKRAHNKSRDQAQSRIQIHKSKQIINNRHN